MGRLKWVYDLFDTDIDEKDRDDMRKLLHIRRIVDEQEIKLRNIILGEHKE